MRKRIALTIVAVLALVLGCQAQFIGYTSSQSSQQTVFLAQAANGVSSILSNIGQSAHFVTVCTTSASLTVSLESSADGTFTAGAINTIASANYGTGSAPLDTGCYTLQGGGYYPTFRVRVSNYVAGAVSVWYSGIGSPVSFAAAALGTKGATSPIACDTMSGPSLVNPSTLANIEGLVAGQRIYACSITFSFNGATTAGTFQFGSAAGGACTSFAAVYTINITANTPQIVHVVGGPGGLFRLLPGQQLCLQTTTVTASAIVGVSYAQF